MTAEYLEHLRALAAAREAVRVRDTDANRARLAQVRATGRRLTLDLAMMSLRTEVVDA